MSIVSGTIGAVRSSNATEAAADTAAAASDRALQSTQEMMSPYGKIGAQGLAQLYGTDVEYIDPQTGEKSTYAGQGGDYNLMQDPYTGQTMQMPSYQQEYTDKLGAYEEDPGTKAQRALDTKAMAQQEQQRVGYSTPGASAARSAELSQKYDVSGYTTYKNDLANRYNALQGEFANKRSLTADKYNQLTQKMNLGLGATSSLGAAGQTNAVNQAQAAQSAGQSQAALWSGLGAASANTASTAISGYNAGKTAGLWGATSTAAPAATAAYQGTMVESAAPAYEWAAAL
ncbi:MAG: hypothetical protein JZU65_05670 [Chlorobium sp.]|nr:hypothetical protein [Chlorobium sp.]